MRLISTLLVRQYRAKGEARSVVLSLRVFRQFPTLSNHSCPNDLTPWQVFIFFLFLTGQVSNCPSKFFLHRGTKKRRRYPPLFSTSVVGCDSSINFITKKIPVWNGCRGSCYAKPLHARIFKHDFGNTNISNPLRKSTTKKTR